MEEKSYLVFIYSGFFICTFIFALLMNGLFLKFARTLGIRNNAETVIRWSNQSKPALGGISFFIIFLLSVAVYSIFFEHSRALLNKELLGLLGACAIAFLMGLADDAYNTRPLLKFSAQVVCGIILAGTGTVIGIFENHALNIALTIFWVVAMMNSINMLDNMDAITTTVSITIVLAALLLLYLNHDYSNIHVIILLGVLASLCGFLFYNWHPSKMFMGDTGSQFLGVFLAAIGIMYFWNTTDVNGEKIQSKQVIVTALSFMIPIIDTTTVVINRISKGRSPFVGGKDHTTHHLSYRGFTDREVALIFAVLALMSMILTVLIIKYIDNWSYTHIALFGSYFLLVFGVLFGITRMKKRKDDKQP
jgi:UDP-GlcNAc:undecaprenyl-phosphate/decaprenyl-phosphate GlcNAc-1-phosphate transferase